MQSQNVLSKPGDLKHNNSYVLKMRTRIDCLIKETETIIHNFLKLNYPDQFSKINDFDNWIERINAISEERKKYFLEYTIGFYSGYYPLPYDVTIVVYNLNCCLNELVQALKKLDLMMASNKDKLLPDDETQDLQTKCRDQYSEFYQKLEQLIHYIYRMKCRPLTLKELARLYISSDRKSEEKNSNLLPPTEVARKVERMIKRHILRNKCIGFSYLLSEFDAAFELKIHAVERRRGKVDAELQQRKSSYVAIQLALEKEKMTTERLQQGNDCKSTVIKELQDAYDRSDSELSGSMEKIHDMKVKEVSDNSRQRFVSRIRK